MLTKLPSPQKARLRQLFDRKARLCCQLFGRQTKLPPLLRSLRGQLFCRQTELPRSLSGRKTCLRALRTKRSSKLSGLLGPALLSLKRGLCPLRGRLKTCGPHLRRGPALLLQDVTLQFLFCNRLTRSTKSARPYRLCGNPLLGNLPLPRDVRKRLLDRGVFKLSHKRRNLRRIKAPARAGQARNALLCGSCAQSARLLQRLRRLRRNPTRALNCCRLIRRRLLSRGPRTRARRLRNPTRRTLNAAKARKSLFICANAACRRLLSRGPRCFGAATKSLRRLRGAKTSAQPGRTRSFRSAKTCRTKRLRAETGLCPSCVNSRLRAGSRTLRSANSACARLPQGCARALNCAPCRLNCGCRIQACPLCGQLTHLPRTNRRLLSQLPGGS